MHGLVWSKHEYRCWRARGADVSFRDVTIKIPERGCDQECEWRHAPEAWAEIWEKSVSWVPGSEEDGWLSWPHVLGSRWKSQHRKMVSLSLCRKTFQLKVYKTFRTWTKKSLVVLGFRDSYVIYIYIYMCVCVFMNIPMSISHICIMGMLNKGRTLRKIKGRVRYEHKRLSLGVSKQIDSCSLDS